MENISTELTKALVRAAKAAFPSVDTAIIEGLPYVQTGSKKADADYQYNGLLPLFNRFKKDKEKIKELFDGSTTIVEMAHKLIEKVDDERIGSIETTPQGFVIIKLSKEYVEKRLTRLLRNEETLEYKAAKAQHVVVDYSSPNIAKEMHVGHLRSTIIGESITRTLEELGHTVDRQNHVGDWGTQFGMLIEYMREKYPSFDPDNPTEFVMEDLTTFYKSAKVRFDEDDEFKDKARKAVYALQTEKEPFSRAAWKLFCDMSMKEFRKVYSRLNVSEDLKVKGESYYNDAIPGVIEEIRPYLVVVDGATCLFVDGQKKDEVPLMVVKSDGGFGYDTTDLAAIKDRFLNCKADRIVIVTDIGQAPHFDKIFKASKICGWTTGDKKADHVGHGLVLGEDGKKFKTRSGESVKLVDLLDEAVSRARKEIESRIVNMSEEDRALVDVEQVSRSVGYGAVKYFDLKQHRTTNYAFAYDDMLAYNGNTAVYILYAYARICSIFRKCGFDPDAPMPCDSFTFENPAEERLTKFMLKWPEILDLFQRDLHIHNICTFLYDLCTQLNKDFYGECRVLNDPRQMERLMILKIVKEMIQKVLLLLSLEPVDRI